MIEPPIEGVEVGPSPIPIAARRATLSAPDPEDDESDERIALQGAKPAPPAPIPPPSPSSAPAAAKSDPAKTKADAGAASKKKAVDLNAMDKESSAPPNSIAPPDPDEDSAPQSESPQPADSRPKDPRRSPPPAPSAASSSSKPGTASGSKPSSTPAGRAASETTAVRTQVDAQVAPIDLPSALKLAGCRDLDVALARERISKSLAELDKAHALWLPSLYFGPQFIRQDGSAQFVGGTVQNVNKNSLHLGLTAAAGQGGTGPVPAGGPSQLNGLSSILRISDAIFEPLAAKQVVAARQANLQSATNDALLGVAESYVRLQDAAGRVSVTEESISKLGELGKLLESQADLSQRLKLDAKRVQGEFHRQQSQREDALGKADVRSAELANRLRLDPKIRVVPIEPAQASITMVPPAISLDDLVVIGLRSRPELSEAQWLVQATLSRLKQAKLRPFIPSLAMRFSGGGFGGGPNDFFGNFNVRGDTDVSLFWQVENLGLGDRARLRDRASEQRTAYLQWMKVQDKVAAEIVAEHRAQAAAHRQLGAAAAAVSVAYQSADEVLKAVKDGQREPWEAVQAIQALAQARLDYLDATTAYNTAQFRLHRALGHPVGLDSPTAAAHQHAHVHPQGQPATSATATAPESKVIRQPSATPRTATSQLPSPPAAAAMTLNPNRSQAQPPQAQAQPQPQPRRIPLEHANPSPPGSNTRALSDDDSDADETPAATAPDSKVRRTQTEEPAPTRRFSGLRGLFR